MLAELSKWSDEERSVIDFLEDPVAYHGGDWQEFGAQVGVPLANDRHAQEDRGDSQVLVIKPALQEVPRAGRVVVTSYMDHPLGQAFAAWEAARAGVSEVCGLQTHGLFAREEFGEALGEVSPKFAIPEGSGLGFDDLLEQVQWRKLGS